MPRITHCRECGLELKDKKPGALFCTPEHRKAFNNRRMIRGAEMYDLIMAQNYERELRSPLELQTLISRLARAARDSDKFLRDGRKSWNAQETADRIPLAYGEEGDKR